MSARTQTAWSSTQSVHLSCLLVNSSSRSAHGNSVARTPTPTITISQPGPGSGMRAMPTRRSARRRSRRSPARRYAGPGWCRSSGRATRGSGPAGWAPPGQPRPRPAAGLTRSSPCPESHVRGTVTAPAGGKTRRPGSGLRRLRERTAFWGPTPVWAPKKRSSARLKDRPLSRKVPTMDRRPAASVTCELDVRLVVPGEASVPVPVVLQYASTDPYAVQATFRTGGQGVDVLPRAKLIAAGVNRPVGQGDVRALAEHRPRRRGRLPGALLPGWQGPALGALAVVLRDFVARTALVVPPGQGNPLPRPGLHARRPARHLSLPSRVGVRSQQRRERVRRLCCMPS